MALYRAVPEKTVGAPLIKFVDVISTLGLEKGSVLRHMTSVIQPILEKGIVDHTIIHRLLMEYFSIADKVLLYPFPVKYNSTAVESTSRLDDWYKGWSQTWNSLCKTGSAMERKKIIKGMKGHIDKIAYHEHGCMVSPDDLAPLNSYIPSLSVKVEEPGDDEPKEDMEVTADEANKDGDNSHLVESGKKDPIVRRQELLSKSGLAEYFVTEL
ncbi:pumilio-like protein 24-like [Senna tora]|uniref:Pumilio-like protein 24-like n=1 Tax=Senna tora TaxID=362788 RepID=A0A834WZL7_9FABA|nr:pumilio-like protein 24-like [Senna tora]